MSQKIVTIFGATGNQGGSFVNVLLNTAELSSKYKVRAMTRDPTKASAQAIQQKGAELAQADLNDKVSLVKAISGSYAVFGMTNFWETMSKDKEVQQGKNIVDVCISTGVKHLIWSSLPHATHISGGKLTHIQHFDGKAEVEEYATTHKGNMTVSFFMPAFFMSNLKGSIKPGQDGVPAWAGPMDANKTNVPMIAIKEDTGKYLAGLLEAGEAADGARVQGVSEWATPAQVVKTLSDTLHKQVNFTSVPLDIYKGFLPPAIADELGENMALIGDFDYFGTNSKQQQAESDKFFYDKAGGKVSLAAFIQSNGPWEL